MLQGLITEVLQILEAVIFRNAIFTKVTIAFSVTTEATSTATTAENDTGYESCSMPGIPTIQGAGE
jgi:hypothetical protein